MIKRDEDGKLVHGGKVMSLFDHLDELRSRIIKSLVAFFCLFCVAMVFSEELLQILKVPLVNALPEGVNALHFTGPMDVFMVGMRVAGLVTVVASCPIWLYQFWKFVEPALYPKERKYILPFVFFSIALFLSGIAFCYTIVLPMTLHFMIGLGLKVGTPIITITDYISVLTLMLFGFGLVFETPLILVLLGLLDIVSADMLTEYRRVIFVVMLVVAAIFTPPDVISMLAMAVPMYIMFELAIIIIRVLTRKRRGYDAANLPQKIA